MALTPDDVSRIAHLARIIPPRPRPARAAAARDHAGRGLSPGMWAPHAARIEVVDVPALHGEMMGDAAMRVIVPAIRERM